MAIAAGLESQKLLEVGGRAGLVFQVQASDCVQRMGIPGDSVHLLFLQALGYLGNSDKFVMDALWQVVSLQLH